MSLIPGVLPVLYKQVGLIHKLSVISFFLISRPIEVLSQNCGLAS